MTAKDVKDFWSSLDQSSVESCWEWRGEITNGYGRVKLSGRAYWAHRFAYWQSKGSIPRGLVVMHSCDNRRCCNPNHMSLGTHTENATDRELRGRGNQARGARVAGAKLNDEKIQVIRRRGASGESAVQLAAIFGVSANTVEKILLGKTWRHLL